MFENSLMKGARMNTESHIAPQLDLNFDETPFLVHVGLHKTASTWLQQNVFAENDAGFFSPWGGMAHAAVTEFVGVDPIEFSPEQARINLARQAKPIPANARICVLSHESLSSRPKRGMYYAPYVAQRIADTFGNVRVLMIFREQKKMIFSLYGAFIRAGGRRTMREFLGTGDDDVGFAGLCKLPFFRYDRLYKMYQDMFGEGRVLALPLELLARDADEFTRQICAFSGTEWQKFPTEKKANAGWGALTCNIQRYTNQVMRYDRLKPKKGPILYARRKSLTVFDKVMPKSMQDRAAAKWHQQIADRVGDYYREGNAEFSKMLGMDLKEFGYDCAPGS